MLKSFLEFGSKKRLTETILSVLDESTKHKSKKKRAKLRRKVYHSYRNKDGYDIHVHVKKTPHGHAAHFYNKDLGGGVVKTIHWSNPSAKPSKKEMERLGHDSYDLYEHVLLERQHASLDSDSAGKIAEHSAIIHMIGHKHRHAGTYGSDEHTEEISPHEKAIKALGKGKDPKAVATRIAHGREMANAALAHIKAKHGPTAYIKRVGHTSKNGDIGRFTGGRHNDGQENPSDMAVEIGFTKKAAKKKGK